MSELHDYIIYVSTLYSYFINNGTNPNYKSIYTDKWLQYTIENENKNINK